MRGKYSLIRIENSFKNKNSVSVIKYKDEVMDIAIYHSLEKRNIGRKKLVDYNEATENILYKYFNLEIGIKEAKELLGFSNNTRTSWYKLLNIYKEKYNIPSTFKNNIDLSQSQKIEMNYVIKIITQKKLNITRI